MIQMPQRSVTRFFIPLIDVLTLLFCIYLLMPIVKPSEDGNGAEGSSDAKLSADERRELERLRREKQDLKDRVEGWSRSSRKRRRSAWRCGCSKPARKAGFFSAT
jgi:hypothetical protein